MYSLHTMRLWIGVKGQRGPTGDRGARGPTGSSAAATETPTVDCSQGVVGELHSIALSLFDV